MKKTGARCSDIIHRIPIFSASKNTSCMYILHFAHFWVVMLQAVQVDNNQFRYYTMSNRQD